ncbi:hypothetical protein GSI_11384 [Ganoderma sinense ZZ0214-1]|uniref:Uncharacterized protein n=1 Tax=Ganoderma sinense ZZ0214-1 TaxID=1077348 RepID=A0A2G8RVU3_9APHY|nr:hypothetical protein GSI_11384 [Ganoderma sinense ZZ0214-1]
MKNERHVKARVAEFASGMKKVADAVNTTSATLHILEGMPDITDPSTPTASSPQQSSAPTTSGTSAASASAPSGSNSASLAASKAPTADRDVTMNAANSVASA